MLSRLSILAVLVAPLVSALTVNAPSGPVVSGGEMTFTWTVASGDPDTFSATLTNQAFNNDFAFANTINATAGTLTTLIPVVPENQQYTIRLIPINDITTTLAQSPPFTIGPNLSSTASSTAASASTSVTGSGATTRAGPTTGRALPTTSGFGTVISASGASTATAPGSAGASATSAGASSTSSSSAALPVRLDMNMGVIASMILSVIAGAAAVL